MKQRAQYRCIEIPEAEEILKRSDVLVADVRDAASYSRGHIEGAQNVSITTLSQVISETKKSRPILICCYHGHASREYAQVFTDFGFAEVYSLNGGFEGWRKRQITPAKQTADRTLQQWLSVNGFDENDVESTVENATTPLMKASHQGDCDVVRMLIAAGAALDSRNADGNTALWLACVGSHLDVIDVLTQFGIDLDNRNDNGATALMYAASTGKHVVVERLLERGADTTPVTLDGFSALDMAATVECLALLRRADRATSKKKAADAPLGVQ
jgi:rhodanese-related sulfurtransferase